MTDKFDITADGPIAMRVDASGRLMFTPESRDKIIPELVRAFVAGAEFHEKLRRGGFFGGPVTMGIVLHEKPDGSGDLDYSGEAMKYAEKAATEIT